MLRLGVGAAEAADAPASVSLIASAFRDRDRPTALGLYYLHIPLGTMLMFGVGALIVNWGGWQAAFLFAGLPGFILALLLMTTVPDIPHDTTESAQRTGQKTSFTLLRNVAFRRTVGAATLASIAQVSMWTWMAAFFLRHHHLSLVQAGLIVTVALGAAKAVGSAMSGPLVKYLSVDRPQHIWRYPSLALTATVPLGWAMIFTQSTATSIIFAILFGLAMGGWAGPTTTQLVAAVRPDERGMSVSIYQLSTNLLGAGLGPLMTGAVSDALGGNRTLGTAMALVVTLNFGAALLLYLAGRRLEPQTERV